MSDTTRDYLHKFWDLIDDILNTVLFLLIGLEVVTIPGDIRLLVLGVAAIPLALTARAVSVIFPLRVIRPKHRYGLVAPVTLIWGGLRGGISIALALGGHPGGDLRGRIVLRDRTGRNDQAPARTPDPRGSRVMRTDFSASPTRLARTVGSPSPVIARTRALWRRVHAEWAALDMADRVDASTGHRATGTSRHERWPIWATRKDGAASLCDRPITLWKILAGMRISARRFQVRKPGTLVRFG
jgi:hypothetical protein